MLSSDQIEQFFNKTLEWPNWQKDLEEGQLHFLNQIIHRYRFHAYFQNIEIAATDPKDRRTPTLQEVITVGLEGTTGGVCIHQNVFVTILLQSLGFETFMVAGTFIDSGRSDNHVLCIVKQPGDRTYLIDIGSPLPVHESIPLHSLPYTNTAAGMRYEYRFSEMDKVYERWQLDGGFFKGNHADPNYKKLRYVFNLEPRDYSFFEEQPSMISIFTDPATSIFLQCPFMACSLDIEDPGMRDASKGRRFVMVLGTSISLCDDDNLDVLNYKSYDELVPKILEYFPKLSRTLVEKAIEQFNAVAEEAGGTVPASAVEDA